MVRAGRAGCLGQHNPGRCPARGGNTGSRAGRREGGRLGPWPCNSVLKTGDCAKVWNNLIPRNFSDAVVLEAVLGNEEC